MKKVRIRSCLALLLCLCCLCGALCACGAKGSGLKGIYNSSVFDDLTPPMTSGAKLELEGNIVCSGGNLAIISSKKETTTLYRVYDIAANEVVLTFQDSSTEKLNGDSKAGILSIGKEEVFWLTVEKTENKNKSYSTIIYDSKGKEITNLPKQTVPVAVADMMMVENRYYRMEDGTFTLKFERSLLAAELPEFTGWNKDHYYAVNANGFTIYNPRGILEDSYVFPSSAESSVACVMNDGNILIQSVYRCPDDASSYDYYDSESNSKYQLESLLYVTGKGSTTELDLNYVLTANLARNIGNVLLDGVTDFDVITKGIDNIAYILEIKDRRVDSDKIKVVSMGNRGEIKKTLNDTIPGQSVFIALPAVADRYVVITNTSQWFLINEKGEKIGEVTNMKDGNDDFILTGTRVYDLDLKYVCDYGADGYELEQVLDHVLILSKTNSKTFKKDYYILKKGMTSPDVLEGTFSSATDYYYAVQNSDKKYVYYNENGEVIFTSDEELQLICSDAENTALLLKGQKTYYRFSK